VPNFIINLQHSFNIGHIYGNVQTSQLYFSYANIKILEFWNIGYHGYFLKRG
jgi:hypothetical protein